MSDPSDHKRGDHQSAATGKAVAGQATAHGENVIVTTEPLSTAAGASYVLTLGNEMITPASVVLPVIYNGTNTQGDPSLSTLVISLGKAVITIINRHASLPLNGTLQIAIEVH